MVFDEMGETTPRGRGLNLELFYFEQAVSRSHLRITKLGLILILVFTVLPVIALLSLFLLNRSNSMPNVDVTIKPMPPANASIYPTVRQPTPPPAPKALKQPKSATRPSPPAPLPSHIRNSNER